MKILIHNKRHIVILVLILFLTAILVGYITGAYTIGGTCDLISGWNQSPPQHCTCLGLKVTVQNDLPVDGDYRTVCLGLGLSNSINQPQTQSEKQCQECKEKYPTCFSCCDIRNEDGTIYTCP